MNELKLMAIKAKNRLLNKSLRDIYSNLNTNQKQTNREDIVTLPSLNELNEAARKKLLLNRIKNKRF